MTSHFPHGLRGVLPRACLPAGEAVATAGGSSDAPRQPSYSGAPSSSDLLPQGDDKTPMQGRSRLNPASPASTGTACGAPYSAAAFVNEWIGPGPKPAPIPRDFTFKAVIGEPEW